MSDLDAKTLYEQVSENYRHFVTWRERLFAGYIAVFAALGLGYAQTTHENHKMGLVAAGLLLALVFWVLDLRSSVIYTACQNAGVRLERKVKADAGPGVYTALNTLARARKKLAKRSRWGWRGLLSLGRAFNLLVSGTIAGLMAVVALHSKWLCEHQQTVWIAAGSTIALFLALSCVARCYEPPTLAPSDEE